MFDISDPNWRAFPESRTKALSIFPNQLWWNSATREGALIAIKPARYDEFALSQYGIEYLLAALSEGRITAAHVMLARRHGGSLIVVRAKPVGEVAAALTKVPPRDGPFGSHKWVRPDFTPDHANEMADSEVPF
jgi:hypothetical protein